jgi:ankyrin repeat protein
MPLEAYLTETVIQNKAILHARDLTGRTALEWAVDHGWVDAAKSLILHGSDLNQRRGLGFSMLHVALAGPLSGTRGTSFLEIVRMLLAWGSDPRAVDDEGWTPLHVAASWDSQMAVDILRQTPGGNLIIEQRTLCFETAHGLAQKNRDGHGLLKTIVSSPL